LLLGWHIRATASFLSFFLQVINGNANRSVVGDTII